MQLTVIVEHGPTSVGTYVPDLPDCVAVGSTEEDTRRLITEAIALHLGGMREDDLPVPAGEGGQ